jgi:hypothetical protein
MNILYVVFFIMLVYIANCYLFYRLMVKYNRILLVFIMLTFSLFCYLILFPFSDLISFLLEKFNVPIHFSHNDAVTIYELYSICFLIAFITIVIALVRKRKNKKEKNRIETALGDIGS